MVKFDFSDNFVLIRTTYSQKDRCTAVPGGKWLPRERAWQYLLTPATASSICQNFGSDISKEDRQILQELAQRLIKANNIKEGKGDLRVPDTREAPWHHQLVSYNMTRELCGLDSESPYGGGSLIALDMGPQPLDAKLLTPNGWTTMGEIKKGDFVIGSNGKPTKVLEVIPQGFKDVFEVIFSDKASTKCSGDHFWSIISPRDKWKKRKYRDFTLSKIQELGLRNNSPKNKYWKWFIPITEPVEFIQNESLPIDPYLLGALIGDGGLTQGIRFSTNDKEILDILKSIVPKEMEFKKYGSHDYTITTPRGQGNELWNQIQLLGLNVRSENKYIPIIYLTASVKDRISLLQGLLDTDGHTYAGSAIEYSTSSLQLAWNVQSLVRSLGGTATMNCKKTSRLDSYRIHLRVPSTISPFRLTRKANKYNGKSNPTRSIRKIISIGKAPVQCIRVEAEDGLYITDDFIVTHNCGKSKVAIDLICNYPHIFQTVLVICPAPVIDVWVGTDEIEGQFKKHATEEAYKRLHIVAINGKETVEKKTQRAEMMRNYARQTHRQFVAVVNYESAWREPFASWAKKVNFDLVVGDELHRTKTPSGKASKFFDNLAKYAKYRFGLTGTPMPHDPLDIFAQYRFLDPGIYGTSYTRFRSEYAVMGGYCGHQILNFKNLDDLHNKMFLIAHRVKSEDVFDLPQIMDLTRTCNLSKEEMDIYQKMDQEFCVEVQNGVVTAANALVKLLRLQEITSGFLGGQPIGTSKQKLLSDVLEDFAQDEPIVIFARFTNDLRVIRAVAEGLGRSYAELSGAMNQVDEWKLGKKNILGVQIKSGREGVDFTRARYCIYYSMGFSLGDYEQSKKRINRPGQTREGFYIHLLANHTVDFKVLQALNFHKDVIQSVLDYYKNL